MGINFYYLVVLRPRSAMETETWLSALESSDVWLQARDIGVDSHSDCREFLPDSGRRAFSSSSVVLVSFGGRCLPLKVSYKCLRFFF